MYTDFRIRNFRCFDELELTDLKKVNLIAGKNNAGKTAFLEGLFIHAGAHPELTTRIGVFRGLQEFTFTLGRATYVETPWDSLFKNLQTSKSISFAGKHTRLGNRLIQLSVVRDHDELVKIDESFRTSKKPTVEGTPRSLEVQVLRLRRREGRRRKDYYMIIDQQGFKIRPYPPQPPFQTVFLPARRGPPTLHEDAVRFGNLEVRGRERVILKALQKIDERLKRLTVVAKRPIFPKDRSSAIIHGDIGIERLLPLPLMGEGMTRLASLILAIGEAENGVVLVDEIENGIHFSVMSDVWKVIYEAARKFNTQIFATTHSLECIKAAHQAFMKARKYDFCLHRLEHLQKEIHATSYSQETLEAALETRLEVR